MAMSRDRAHPVNGRYDGWLSHC